jgi:hypothetical protein
MEKFGILYGNLEYITAIGYILWPFGKLVVIWYIFPRLGIVRQEKSGNPASTQDFQAAKWATCRMLPLEKMLLYVDTPTMVKSFSALKTKKNFKANTISILHQMKQVKRNNLKPFNYFIY